MRTLIFKSQHVFPEEPQDISQSQTFKGREAAEPSYYPLILYFLESLEYN